MMGYHNPPDQAPPPPRSRPPPCAVHAGRYGQQADGMHPTGMQSCFFCRQWKKIKQELARELTSLSSACLPMNE